ncbi:MAG: methylated-DNA--[protein]-cysteine S-methyltransferase [Acidobacteriia bacterium]|nr:methylated-DNA--[protein]-cysteine S-methyltransferase [Terriglobia bacterium]
MYELSDFKVSEGFSLSIETGPAGVRRIEFGARGVNSHSSPVMREVIRQLRLYFAGDLREFDVPLELIGTDFQKRVWNALLTIPYGETRSYTEIAWQIGAPRAVRAVGAANGRNPIPIIVPCHRVIGASGSLVGFGGGLEWKRKLLDLEGNSWKKSGTLFSIA